MRVELVNIRELPWVNRGIVYTKKGEFDQAFADFAYALRLDPNSAVAYFSRSNVHYAKGDIEKAIADLEAALRIDPHYTNAKNNLNILKRKQS